jgi:hypothetical protein
MGYAGLMPPPLTGHYLTQGWPGQDELGETNGEKTLPTVGQKHHWSRMRAEQVSGRADAKYQQYNDPLDEAKGSVVGTPERHAVESTVDGRDCRVLDCAMVREGLDSHTCGHETAALHTDLLGEGSPSFFRVRCRDRGPGATATAHEGAESLCKNRNHHGAGIWHALLENRLDEANSPGAADFVEPSNDRRHPFSGSATFCGTEGGNDYGDVPPFHQACMYRLQEGLDLVVGTVHLDSCRPGGRENGDGRC